MTGSASSKTEEADDKDDYDHIVEKKTRRRSDYDHIMIQGEKSVIVARREKSKDDGDYSEVRIFDRF